MRDLYGEVPTRIVAEMERGAAPWIKPWSATPGQNVPQNAVTNRPYSGCNVILLWLARNRGWLTPRFLTFKQALDVGGNVRKGEHGTKVYFVKQLQIRDGDGEEANTRLVPMLREYTVFNVDQCETLPDNIRAGKPMRVRNPDTRDALADEFLCSTSRTLARDTVKRITCRAMTSPWRRDPAHGSAVAGGGVGSVWLVKKKAETTDWNRFFLSRLTRAN
jgi:antirestriction protein ArdC